jgi:hypothetical protein
MPLETPITPGTVDWTGENPGIILKAPDGGVCAVALFFRIAWSPVGQGHVLALFGTPGAAQGPEEAPNVLLSDNPALGEFIRDTFIARLEGLAAHPAFGGLRHETATSVRAAGDPMGARYAETVSRPGLTIDLVWEGLERPRALELPPELTGTQAHTMFTLLVPAQRAEIRVNGRSLPGEVGLREQAGMKTSTAFLYFSETWIFPPEGA